MFILSEVIQYLQNGQFARVLEILKAPLLNRTPIVLSKEDQQQLLTILLVLNDVPCVEDTEDFKLVREILNTLDRLLPKTKSRINPLLSAQGLAAQRNTMMVDYILAEENLRRGFLRHSLFQEFIINYAADNTTPFMDRFMRDADYTLHICQYIDPNYFISPSGNNILAQASFSNNVSQQSYDTLIANGADVNGRGYCPPYLRHRITDLYTPLAFNPNNNMRSSQLETSKIYISSGRATPLLAAISAGRMAHVERLLAAPNIIISRDEHEVLAGCRNVSPLMLAAYLGHLNIVRALLARGANINEVDNFGESAIFYALRGNYLSVFYFLLEQPGVNTSLSNLQDRSLEDLMHSFNYPAMAELFSPIARLRLLIENRPEFLGRYILNLIDSRLTMIADGLAKDNVIPFLTDHQKQFHALWPRSSSSAGKNLFSGRFVTMFENHVQAPYICDNTGDINSTGLSNIYGNYVVRHAATGSRYQVFQSRLSLEKIYFLLKMAYQFQLLQQLPFEYLEEFIANLTSEEIINLFETPEDAALILNDPQLDNSDMGHGERFGI